MAKKKQPTYGEGAAPYKFYLNGEPVETIPPEALDKMAERLSRVVSLHFAEHPDEYEAFLRSREQRRAERNRSV